MEKQEKTRVIVVEKDQEVVNLILQALKDKPFQITICSGTVETVTILREKLYGLILIGDTHEGDSPFDFMKAIVTASPMTSIILITDLKEKEIRDKSEGYGILGYVNRAIPSGDLTSLTDQFENISGSLSLLKS